MRVQPCKPILALYRGPQKMISYLNFGQTVLSNTQWYKSAICTWTPTNLSTAHVQYGHYFSTQLPKDECAFLHSNNMTSFSVKIFFQESPKQKITGIIINVQASGWPNIPTCIASKKPTSTLNCYVIPLRVHSSVKDEYLQLNMAIHNVILPA